MNPSSTSCRVRRLTPADVPEIFALSMGNPLFYQHCPPFVTEESILADMAALPPGVSSADKFYVGFFQGDTLIAVLDLILGYPDEHTAFVGLFMTRREIQGKGVGSALMADCARCLQAQGFRRMRLAYAKGNPQSAAFWRKNGFRETGEAVDKGDYTAVLMERPLSPEGDSGAR